MHHLHLPGYKLHKPSAAALSNFLVDLLSTATRASLLQPLPLGQTTPSRHTEVGMEIPKGTQTELRSRDDNLQVKNLLVGLPT